MRTGADVLRDPRLYRLAAALQATDAAICVPPIPYVRRCLDDVHWPQQHRWFFPLVKAASAVGLAAAPRFPRLGRVTTTMLTLYFSVAVGAISAWRWARTSGRATCASTSSEPPRC